MAQEVNFDELKIETGPRINKFRFSKEEKSVTKRIFFNPKVWKDVSHFKDGYGYFKCLLSSGKCPACESGIKQDTRYGMHVLTYMTDGSGNLKTPFSYDIQALIKSEKSFAKIYKLFQQYGQKDMFSHDFLVSCDNTDFQNLSFNIDLKCVWMQQPNKVDILADIKAKVAEFDLSKIIAPDITLETMQSLVDGKIPNRYATKNQPAGTGAPAQDTSMTFPPAGSTPMATAGAKPAATSSDLDLLESLSK